MINLYYCSRVVRDNLLPVEAFVYSALYIPNNTFINGLSNFSCYNRYVLLCIKTLWFNMGGFK